MYNSNYLVKNNYKSPIEGNTDYFHLIIAQWKAKLLIHYCPRPKLKKKKLLKIILNVDYTSVLTKALKAERTRIQNTSICIVY